jgi:UDP-glucose 4-epimerase
MRVCVTGAAGFIGSHVCAAFASTPAVSAIIGIDDLSTGSRGNLRGLPVDLIEGSILDRDALATATNGVEAIVHLAARPSVPRSILEPEATHEANATGTMRVLEAARDSGNVHTIVASSSSVYGANPALPKHEGLVPAPLSPYAVSKLAAEQYALAWQHSFHMPTIAFRFFNVFGPRQAPGHAYAAVIPAFVHAAVEGRPLSIFGDGTQSRDFTYVGTVAEVLVDAVLRRVVHPGPVNLAFGSRTTLLQLIDLIESIIGHPLEREHLPTRAGDVPHSQADMTLLRSLFRDVEPVALEDGVRATVEWMRSR